MNIVLFFFIVMTSYASLAQDNMAVYQATVVACGNFRHDIALKGYTFYQIPKSPVFNKIIIEIFEESAKNPSTEETPKLGRLIDNSGFKIAMSQCYPNEKDAANKKLFLENLRSVDKGGLLNNLGQFAGVTLITLPLGYIKGIQLIAWISKASLFMIAGQLSWAGYRFATQPKHEIAWTNDSKNEDLTRNKEIAVDASRQLQKQKLQEILTIKQKELLQMTAAGASPVELTKIKEFVVRAALQIEIINRGL